jgi:predicted Zn-dependent protease
MEGRQFPGNASQEFRDRADAQYRKILLNLAARGILDDDPAMLARVQRVSQGLIRAATAIKAQAGAWTWEIHETSDPRQSAFCMAGGKLLVGGAFVRQLALDDAELAMLIGHEIAHALAEHRRERPPASLDADLSWELKQSEIAMAQEIEADEIGMELAHRAGWPAPGLVGFYEKLAASESPGTFNSSHPSASARLAMAKAMAQRLGR